MPRPQDLTELIEIWHTGKMHADETSERTALFARAFAQVKQSGGSKDALDIKHQVATSEYEIVTQPIAGVTAFMAVVWGDRQLEILAPPEEFRDRNNRPWMTIRAAEITQREIETDS